MRSSDWSSDVCSSDLAPRTLRAKLNLSSLYARLGRLDETLAMQLEVIEARKRLLGPRHPDTIYILVNRIATLSQAGRPKDALAMLDTVLPMAREVLGGRHPQTQAARSAEHTSELQSLMRIS